MKQTEIGLIPDDWEVKKLGEISNGFSYGVGAEAVSFNGSDRYIRITDIDDVTNRFSPNPLYSPKFYSSSDIVQENDILFARTGASVGKTYIYDKKDGRLIFAGFLMKLHVKDADSKFIFYQTLTDKYKSWVISESTRTGQPGLNLEQIKNFLIPLPPLPEQQRIAKALSDVDALISTTEKLIQKKKNIKQGTMQNLLTGKKRLPGFAKSTNYKQSELGLIPEDWEVKSLGEFCQIKDGTHGTYARVENGHLLLSAKNILNGKLDVQDTESLISENAYKEIVKNGFPKKKDLLISCVGTIGRCCIFDTDEKIAFQRSVAFIRQNQINNLFLMYFIQSDLFQEQLKEAVNASTLGGVYLGAFNPLQISFPSDSNEQTAIANVLSSMDKEIETLNTKLKKYRNIKTAMMQQLLTGKIRLF